LNAHISLPTGQDSEEYPEFPDVPAISEYALPHPYHSILQNISAKSHLFFEKMPLKVVIKECLKNVTKAFFVPW
jgi:hypothetical protein